MTSPIINIQSIHKTYRQRKAVDVKALTDVSLSIDRGAFYGLIGPNGAGKSTLIKIMTGLSRQDSGVITVDGDDTVRDYQRTRTRIGVSLQEHAFDPYLSVEEELFLTGGYFGRDRAFLKQRIPVVLDMFSLTEKRRTYTDKLSGGMKRRLAIAKALIHQPDILILDEPTAGLDVQLRHELWDILQELNGQGTTILLTTHYLEEVEHLCDRIAIINKGQIIFSDQNKRRKRMENSQLEQLFVSLVEADD